ncbi:hypothetical protein ILYODFUR_019111 [Ilyodon furcidens]|uniref:Transport and Golgi organization protein 2 homolog n=1 Tax=Ilyodon furcidens TaxID=33524 RepID=A0ABV0TZL0_9TELE
MPRSGSGHWGSPSPTAQLAQHPDQPNCQVSINFPISSDKIPSVLKKSINSACRSQHHVLKGDAMFPFPGFYCIPVFVGVPADVRAKQDTVCYYGNRGSSEPIRLNPGIYGLSNSLLDTPWKKLLKGKQLFTSIVNDQSLSCDGLVQELLNVLNNEELNTPDPIQEKQGDGYSKSLIQALSAVCVRSPHYGTRTNTIILIDAEGNVTFTERTMLDFDTSKWSTNSFQFNLQA